MAGVAQPRLSTPLEDLALTNFMLARLRPLLQVRAEAYLKWYLGGAFNGAGYDCSGGQYADVAFYRGDLPSTSAATMPPHQIRCGQVCVNAPLVDTRAVADVLAAADEEFAALRLRSSRGLLEQVTRFQVWLIYRSTDATSTADLERLAATVASATGGTTAFAGRPYTLPPDGDDWNGDVELLLPAPVPEAALRARLAAFFALGDQTLFGFGATCPNHDGTNCPDPALRYAHLTARQF